MSDFYSATIFLSVFIMIIMAMLVSGNDLMEHDKKQTVYTISVLVIACMVSEWFGVWMNGADPSLRTLHILVKTIELSTAPIITVLCSDLMTPLKHKKLIYTLIGVHAGLEVLSAFFGFIFSVDAQNVYHHETFYWVYVLAYASGVLLFIGQLLSESSHHYGLYRALVIILPVFFFCGLFLQYGAGVHIMWACSAVDVLMVYILYSELTQKIDTLTRLLNRRSYESRLASLRGHAVIYYFDVDEFKSVNDTFGHGVGDTVLAEVGSTIYAVFSKVGYCYPHRRRRILRHRANFRHGGGKVSFGIPARADGTASEKRAPAARVGRLCVLQSGARQRRGCDQTRRPDDVPLQAQAQKRSAHK